MAGRIRPFIIRLQYYLALYQYRLALGVLLLGLLFFAVYVNAATGPVDEVILAYTCEGASTIPVVVNPTAADINFPGTTSCTPLGGCTTTPGPVVKARSVLRFDPIKPLFGCVSGYPITIPDPALIAYSEVRTGNQALFRYPPLTARDYVRYLDAATPGPYNPWFIFIADGPYDIQLGDQHVVLQKYEGMFLPVPPNGQFSITAQLGSPKFYTIVGLNDPRTGSQQLVEPK